MNIQDVADAYAVPANWNPAAGDHPAQVMNGMRRLGTAPARAASE